MKLAVASCSKLQQVNPQPVWSEIKAEKPDVLLLLGDNIYLDHDHHSNAEPNFAPLLADLRARNAPVIAIYDDHDFLGNNRYGGDHDPALANAARAEFVLAFSPTMTGKDLYHRRTIGNVDIVLLDERFYRRSPASSRTDRRDSGRRPMDLVRA